MINHTSETSKDIATVVQYIQTHHHHHHHLFLIVIVIVIVVVMRQLGNIAKLYRSRSGGVVIHLPPDRRVLQYLRTSDCDDRAGHDMIIRSWRRPEWN